MISLCLPERDSPFHVLCLGAHCDDIEIGCGATLMKMVSEHPSIVVTWVVFSSDPVRAAEARESASRILGDSVSSDLSIFEYRNGYFPYNGAEIKDCFEALKTKGAPDLIFTHHGADRHQDHRLIAELTWNTFRNHWILEYEIPKYDGGLGSPNCFVPIQKSEVERKSDILLECFKSQGHRPWFSKSTFRALMRLRGVECNSDSGYAEAFYAKKIVLG